jgi:hypothetical protein
MGYRSNVDVVFYTRDTAPDPMPYAALKLWVDENYPVREAEDEWDAETTYSEERGFIYISYLDVKWYHGDHPSRVEAALKLFDKTFEDHLSVAYEFVRIGEELDDVEEMRSVNADYLLGVKREIYFER